MIATWARSQNAVFFLFFGFCFFPILWCCSSVFLFVFFQFCDVSQVATVVSTFSQIWRDSIYESRKSEVRFHIVGNCGDFFSLFLYFWRLKKQGICDRSFFFQNISRKMAKIRHQKNRCCQGSSSMVRSLLLKIVGRLSDYKQISTSPKSYSSWVVGLAGFARAKKKSFWSRICAAYGIGFFRDPLSCGGFCVRQVSQIQPAVGSLRSDAKMEWTR